jgi:PAS domain S-box-containing protein
MPSEQDFSKSPFNNLLQNALEQSEEKYRLLVDGVKDYAIFMLDPEGYVESWNDGARKLKGYEYNEIVGKHFSIFYPREVKERGYPEYELKEAANLGRFEDEGWRVRRDGSLFYANVVITAMRDQSGKLLGFSKITRDLTEKKRTEEMLRRSEEKYRLLIEGIKDYAIYMLDPEGKIVSWNEGAKRLKQYEEKEVIGKDVSIFYPQDKQKANYAKYELEQAIKYGKFEDEGVRVRKDGSQFIANVIITPIYNEKKELLGFSKITRDLTELKLAEQKLSKLNEELEKRVEERTQELSHAVEELKKINNELDNFIYTASHDLKAPVLNIEGLMTALTKALKKYNFDNPEINKLLAMINLSVARFQSTIKDLASINESNKTSKEDSSEILLTEMIEDVLLSIDHLAKESKAEITINTDQLPSIRFSKVQIKSIIYNLLINAIKYRSHDRSLEIRISSWRQDNNNVLEITDNGLGINEENKEKIFQMFKRLHSHVEGSGIGLYLVKRIVDNARGKIEVESEIGKGSTFRVFLPDQWKD